MNAPVASADVRPWERAVARVFGFSCFFPYPALPIGGNTGLQLNHALTCALVPLLVIRPLGRGFLAYLLLLGPVFLSMFLNVLIGDIPALDVLPKEAIAFSLAISVLWATDFACRRGVFRDVLAAAVLAIGLHALVGMIQLSSFSHDEFPLLFLYKNPSFKSMEEWAPTFARYIKRPCGLFPEPSAMAASLGPWLVVLSGLIIEPNLAARVGWKMGRLAPLALAGGFLLLALSRSGSTFATMAAVVAVALPRLMSRARTSGLARFAKLAFVLLAVLGVTGYAAAKLSGGLEERMESSWGLRSLSIQQGLISNTDAVPLTIGVGPGQSTPIIRRQLAYLSLLADQDELAVFSLTVCYYMETGLIGALAMLAVLVMVVQAIRRSSAALLGFSAFGSWIVGVTVTTSYMPLSAIWLLLGALLAWDRLFPRVAPAASEVLA